MKHKDLEHYRLLLQAERRQLLETMESFKEQGIHENMNDVSGELSAYDQHPADCGSQMFEREKDQGLLENLMDQLHLVDQALERIDQGTYGICRQCRQPISPERLEVLPQASLCVRCKLEEEKQQQPEVKKQEFSFRRSFTDGTSFVGFDGEDAWQSVARFGTANTRQDYAGIGDLDDEMLSDEEMDVLDAVEEYTDTD